MNVTYVSTGLMLLSLIVAPAQAAAKKQQPKTAPKKETPAIIKPREGECSTGSPKTPTQEPAPLTKSTELVKPEVLESKGEAKPDKKEEKRPWDETPVTVSKIDFAALKQKPSASTGKLVRCSICRAQYTSGTESCFFGCTDATLLVPDVRLTTEQAALEKIATIKAKLHKANRTEKQLKARAQLNKKLAQRTQTRFEKLLRQSDLNNTKAKEQHASIAKQTTENKNDMAVILAELDVAKTQLAKVARTVTDKKKHSKKTDESSEYVLPDKEYKQPEAPSTSVPTSTSSPLTAPAPTPAPSTSLSSSILSFFSSGTSK
jgi:hypothetical protein